MYGKGREGTIEDQWVKVMVEWVSESSSERGGEGVREGREERERGVDKSYAYLVPLPL